MHEVLVNRLGGLSLPRKSVVRLTDRPDMTLDVYRGRKTTMQQQQHIIIFPRGIINFSHHIIKFVHDIIKFSHDIIKFEHHIIKFARDIIKITHHIIKFIH